MTVAQLRAKLEALDDNAEVFAGGEDESPEDWAWIDDCLKVEDDGDGNEAVFLTVAPR